MTRRAGVAVHRDGADAAAPFAGRRLLVPLDGSDTAEAALAPAAAYLDRLSARLAAQGARVKAVVARGEVVRALLDIAAQRAIDVIVIATHGRSGVGAVWAGSVAARILAHSTPPVLLVRIPAPGSPKP